MTVDADAPVYVAGHQGLVGSALRRALLRTGHRNILTEDRRNLDLRRQDDVNRWFADHRPGYVYLAAGTVGGIKANATRQAEFLYDNMMIHANVIEASRVYGVEKLLYLGSACVYPRQSPQPIPEDALLTGPLEPTNEGYSLAKIAGMRLCDFYQEQYGCRFVSAMPTNLYGPGDNFDPESSHVIPALIRRFHEAKTRGDNRIELWGSGTATRDFMFVDDLADACLFLMRHYEGPGHINVGSGAETPIAELAQQIRDAVHPTCEIAFSDDGLDGMPRRAINADQLANMGWRAVTGLSEGLRRTYSWYLTADEDVRRRRRRPDVDLEAADRAGATSGVQRTITPDPAFSGSEA